MTQDVIDALHQRAKAVAFLTGRHLGGGFQGYWHEDLEYDVYGPNSILFKLNKGDGREYHIDFANIVPYKITRSIIHPAIPGASTSVDSSSTVIENASDSATLEQTYDVDISEENTHATDVGVSVLIGLATSLSVGGDIYGAKLTAELKTEINTSYNAHNSSTDSESRSTSTTLIVPPSTRATVTTMRNLGKFSQRAEYWSDLNHSIRLWDQGCNKNLTWDTVEELLKVLRGEGDNTLPLAREFRGDHAAWDRNADDGRWNNNLEKLKAPREVYYETTLKFDKATTGNIRVTTENI